MASSCSSSNVTHTPVLDELFAVSGETEIPKVIKILFEQQIAEEELNGKYLVKKIDDVKDSLKRVRKAINEMESKSDKEAWTDFLDCFKDNKTSCVKKIRCDGLGVLCLCLCFLRLKLLRGVSDNELRGEMYSRGMYIRGQTFAVIKDYDTLS
ncbi:hypothetical protein Tco_0324845 [Tanacetum coccineum]